MKNSFSSTYYRNKAGLLSKEEKNALREELKDDKYARYAADNLSAISELNYKKSLDNFKAFVDDKKRKKTARRLKQVVVSFAVAASITLGILLINKPQDNVLNQPVYSSDYTPIYTIDSCCDRSTPHPPSNIEDYIDSALRYPSKHTGSSISGVVVLSVEVMQDSTLGKIEVLKSLGDSFDQEAIRVVEASQKWIPALRNNKVINSIAYFEIAFHE